MTKKRGDIMEGEYNGLRIEEQPGWLQDRLNWFMDLRFGLFIHWGPYCQWDCMESWGLVPEDTWSRREDMKCWTERNKDLQRFSQDYWNLNKTFNPIHFDADNWARIAEKAGMKYITFTTKHHDGFSMFDTAATDYRITHPDCPFHSSPKADITKAVFKAFQQRSMAVSCYFSKSDWNCPFYWSPDFTVTDRNPNYDTHKNPELWQKFVDFVHCQIKELMTDYGKIDALWLDGGQVRPPDQDIQMEKMITMARKLQPGLIVADRTVGGPYENIITPEQKLPETPPGMPWESCITLGNSWKFKANDHYKSPRQVIHMLVEAIGKGGNLLLGVGPDPLGLIPADAIASLEGVGQWVKTHHEAVFGTRPIAPYSWENIHFTAGDEALFAFILLREDEILPQKVEIRNFKPQAGSAIRELSENKELPWQETADGFWVDLNSVTDKKSSAVVIKFAKS